MTYTGLCPFCGTIISIDRPVFSDEPGYQFPCGCANPQKAATKDDDLPF